jgi:hypothetical protein
MRSARRHRKGEPIPGERGIASRVTAQAVVAGLLAVGGLASGCGGCGPGPGPGSQQRLRVRAAELTPMAPQAAAVCAVVAAPSVSDGSAPLAVDFDAEGECTVGGATFTWDFGDGSAPAHTRHTTHTYTAPGRYAARVTLVNDARTASDTDETVITVSAD